MDPITPETRLMVLAWREEEMKLYLRSYEAVMDVLERDGDLSPLVQVENTLLDRMRSKRQDPWQASIELMRELSTDKGKFFVMAAAVDIILNDRSVQERVQNISTRHDTYARL